MTSEPATEAFEVGDHVEYRYGQVRFAGVVLARGWILDVETGMVLVGPPENIRYMVQQDATGIIHVYSPRHLRRY